ncbi:MAG: hypothetical protein KC766_28895 [Myxococcales bacterium]|nr:hypothetical protein [Myxococcales bacterium]
MTRGRRYRLPREHGFWVMLVLITASALIRVRASGWSSVVALGVLLLTPLAGGLLSRRVRGDGSLQLASTVALSGVGVPILWAGGDALANVAAFSLVWLSVNLAGALIVRAALQRRRARKKATVFECLGVALPVGVFPCVLSISEWNEKAALVVASSGLLVLALQRLGPQNLKRLGLSMSALSGVVGVLLAL